MNQLIKPAKTALAKRYGYKNVSVKNGRGTAWGWVEVKINTQRPAQLPCVGDINHFYCSNCVENNNITRNEARTIMHNAWRAEGLEPYHYTVDDSYNTQSEEVLIDVNYI